MKITAEEIKITIAKDDSACPPWRCSFDFCGTESQLRAYILRDANEIHVRHAYTALNRGRFSGAGDAWQVWRVL